MKKFCLMLLTVVLATGLMPVVSFAQESTDEKSAVAVFPAAMTMGTEVVADSKVEGVESIASSQLEPASSSVETQAKKYKISKNIAGEDFGSVTIIGNNATLYPEGGTKVRFRTSPKVGYTLTKMSYTNAATGKTIALKRVSGTGKAGTNSEYEFTMPYGNVTLNATFAVNNKAISKNVTGSGSVFIVNNPDGSKGSLYPQVGQSVTFKAPANKGNRLARMSYTLSSTGKTIALQKVAGTTSTYTFKMPNENVTLNALFIDPVAMRAKGSLGFFELVGGDGDYAAAVLRENQDYTHIGANGDATSLINMKNSLAFIEECNQLRAKEGADPQNHVPLSPLKVTHQMMAISQVQANKSAFTMNHTVMYNVGENLAWGYNDPFKGWYDQEKEDYLSGNVGSTGHYLNIVDAYSGITGFAITQYGNYRVCHEQSFYSGASGAMTIEEYRALFEWYYRLVS